MAIDNQASRFAAAAAHYHRDDPDIINLPLLQDTWEFVFRSLEQPHLHTLIIMKEADIQPWMNHFMDDLVDAERMDDVPAGGDLYDAVDRLIAKFQDVLIPAAEKLAENSDKNLDNTESWRFMLARLPLTDGLANAIEAMTEQQTLDFSVGGDFEGLDPDGGIYWLGELYPDADIGNVTIRLNHLYMDLERTWFQGVQS
jgi:hypothetical protein